MVFDLNRMYSPQVLTWIIMVMVYGFLEIAIGRRNRGGAPRKKVRDATFYTVTVPSMVALYGAVLEATLKNHTIPGPWFIIGGLVLLGGIVLRISALLQLGSAFSTKVETDEGQKLYTKGIYRTIRHPLYLATLLQVAGTGVMLHSMFALVLLPFCVAGIIIRIRKEERFMAKEFPEYGDYREKTKRLIPGVY